MEKVNFLYGFLIGIVLLISGCTTTASLSTSIPNNLAMEIKEVPINFKHNVSSDVNEVFKLKGGYTVNSNQNMAFSQVFENYLQNKTNCLLECEEMDIDLTLTNVEVRTENHTSTGNKVALVLVGAGTTNVEYISSAEILTVIQYKGKTYNKQITADANAQHIWSTYGTGYNYSYQVTKSNTTPQDAIKNTLDNVNLDIIIQVDKFIDSILEHTK